MGSKCSQCGFKTNDKTFYRREKGGVFGQQQTVCEACTVYTPNLAEYRAFYFNLFNAATWSFLVLFHFRDTPDIGLCVAIMFTTTILTTRYQTFIHEAGHAFAAHFSGQDIWRVDIGSGPLLRRIRVAGINFDMRRYGHTGGEAAYFSPNAPVSRTTQMFIVAAGPLANLLTSALCFAAGYAISHWAIPGLIGTAIFSGFGLANLTMAFRNLWPRKSTDRAGLPSDGFQLLKVLNNSAIDYRSDPELAANMIWFHVNGLRHQERHRDAIDIATAHLQSSPYRLSLASMIMDSLSYAEGNQAVVDFYLQHDAELTEGVSEDVSALAYIHANAAWSAIKLNAPSLLNLAGSWSKKAFTTLPERPEIAGTQGAYLIVTGQPEEGIALMLPAIRSVNVQADKADFCKYIAQGYKRLSQIHRAEIFDALAEHLKPA
ncbi:MAG: site-2 protease family protein [Asticcacaulis sp.]|nr:site-2 protease family protein [Asticcacaulis sp.]